MGTIAYEIEHISDHAERVWLRRAIESGRFRQPLSGGGPARSPRAARSGRGVRDVPAPRVHRAEAVLDRGSRRRSCPCSTRRSSSPPARGAHEVVVGIAHRGRLNVLAHTVGRSYASILREFEGERTFDALVSDPEGGTGDVKYHLAASESRPTRVGRRAGHAGRQPEPSRGCRSGHRGTRASRADRSLGRRRHPRPLGRACRSSSMATPRLPARGSSPRPSTSTRSTATRRAGRSTSSPTTRSASRPIPPRAARRATRATSPRGSTSRSSMSTRTIPRPRSSAVRLALAYREEFGHDLVIDLVGYRRFGHNEQDEPAYTQPLMAERIDAAAPGPRDVRCTARRGGVLTAEDAAQLLARPLEALRETHDELRASFADPEPPREPRIPRDTGDTVVTAVPVERLQALNEQLLHVPAGFQVNPKLAKQLERRREAFSEGGIDWGQAEALAFASLLEEGIPIRLSGQDTERGTFSHRHAVLHDPVTGETFTPLQALPEPTPRSRSTTLRSPSTRRSRSSTATPSPRRTHWCSGRRSSATSSTVPRSSSISSSSPGRSKWGQTSRLGTAPPARVRGQRTRALERSPRALPSARRAGEHPRRELHDRRAVLPPPPPTGARRDRAPARRHDAEGPSTPAPGDLDARRSCLRVRSSP